MLRSSMTGVLLILGCLCLCLANVHVDWDAFDTPAGQAVADVHAHAFHPVGSFAPVSEAHFTVLEHPAFPAYRARIKKSHFCDPTVNVYTGYIDIQAKHLFFYFFESRSDPGQDDILLWTNGGPGGSSSLGLFTELGPCRISNATEGPVWHKESWTTKANIIFIEQPINVGYSYAEYGEYVDTTERAAQDVAAFMAIFFENFPAFKGRRFHMAGESYGGRYIPLYAAAVYDQNAYLKKQGMSPINLASIILVNGATDASMTPTYYEMVCTNASGLGPRVDIKSCIRMKTAVPRCRAWLKRSCDDTFDLMDCEAAHNFCENELYVPFAITGLNPYDMSRRCEPADLEVAVPCAPELSEMTAYLNRPEVMEMLGVDTNHVKRWRPADWRVNTDFTLSGDIFQSSIDYVGNLLDRNVSALVFAGVQDLLCNWLANEAWTLSMDWHAKEAFNRESLQPWTVDGEVVGLARSFGKLSFASVYGAGHMSPGDRPKETLELIMRWIAGKQLAAES